MGWSTPNGTSANAKVHGASASSLCTRIERRSVAISGNQMQSMAIEQRSVALTRNPDAISGHQWPPMHLCSANGIEPQLSMPPTPACEHAPYRARVGQGVTISVQSRYNLGTAIRGNQAPYSSSPQGQSEAIRGNQRQSNAIRGHQWQSVAISDNQSPITPARRRRSHTSDLARRDRPRGACAAGGCPASYRDRPL